MDVKVDVDPKKVEEAIVNAVVQSSLGDKIRKVVEEELQKMGNSWDSNDPLSRAIRGELNSIAIEILRKEYKDKLTEAIKQKMSEDFVNKMVDKATMKLVDY